MIIRLTFKKALWNVANPDMHDIVVTARVARGEVGKDEAIEIVEFEQLWNSITDSRLHIAIEERECTCGSDDPRSARFGHNHLVWCTLERPIEKGDK
jgi:hypothetical protein